MMRVAVVGGGLSGLVAAHELGRSGGVRVTVYEKKDQLGSAKTVAVDGGGGAAGRVLVDLDLMVFNRVRNSLHLLSFFLVWLHSAYGRSWSSSEGASFHSFASVRKNNNKTVPLLHKTLLA
jgi:phytoene dehydrogenase-like protein